MTTPHHDDAASAAVDTTEAARGTTSTPRPHGSSAPKIWVKGVPRRAQRTPLETAWAVAREILIVLVGAIIISTLVRMFVVQPFAIPSESMEKTLIKGDTIAVTKLGIKPKRGDVVVFEDFGHWLTREPSKVSPVVKVLEVIGLAPDSSENHLVKRLIGMPGDTVECCDAKGRLMVNGKALDEAEYLYPGVAPSDFPFKVVVPADRVFVMGDHRNQSSDSRCHLRAMGKDAFVPLDKIVGPVGSIVLPANRFKVLKVPSTFERVPAASQAPPAEPLIQADQVTCG